MPIKVLSEEKMKKLPKWIQAELLQRDRKIALLEDLLASLNGSEVTPINFSVANRTYYLPARTTINFKVSTKLWIDVSLRPQDRLGNVVEIYTSDQACIFPESTNHFRVVSMRRMKVVAE